MMTSSGACQREENANTLLWVTGTIPSMEEIPFYFKMKFCLMKYSVYCRFKDWGDSMVHDLLCTS